MKNIILILAILLPTLSWANEWTGTVIGISDGDTLKVLNDKKQQIKIRLTEIDAPESSQAFGTQSKQSLSDICFRKMVVVTDNGTDKYKRTLGRLKCDGIDANAEQVKRGMAWAYRQYLTDTLIGTLEDTAKAGKVGLWADANPTPPWEFRHSGKTASNSGAKAENKKTESSGQFECAGKSRCGDMSSCAEAEFYLTKCGVDRLDRDHDGIPCESLCQ
jgi:endonuclease YncB( thermonuclease family)